MPTVTLSIPLQTTPRSGFFNASNLERKRLLGYNISVRLQGPYQYLEIEDVPREAAADVLRKIRSLVQWAAVRLDFGILCGIEEVRFEDGATFDGQFPTAYPSALRASPVRIEGSHRTEEGDSRLFSALIEGSELTSVNGPNVRKELALALELFSFVDFKSSTTAAFLSLIAILEVLADPAPRPQQCIDIIEDAIKRMLQEENEAQEPATKQALKDMRKGANHWKYESIRSSIRRLAIDVSRAMGDLDPESAGKEAVRLYDKRSKVVHEGVVASPADVASTRQVVREALAKEAECIHHIRERYPPA